MYVVRRVNFWTGLNPCFNGICSRRGVTNARKALTRLVLILVLMEYALEGPIEIEEGTFQLKS